MKFHDVHCKLYKDNDLDWPPNMDALFFKTDNNINATRRDLEIALFVEQKFPVSEDQPCPYFIDTNYNLPRLVGRDGTTNPWQTKPWCITTKSRIYMRRPIIPGATGPVLVERRWLLGVELMQLMGWDRSLYVGFPLGASNDEINRLLTNLAGNAFSAFSTTAAIIAMLCGLALMQPAVEITLDDDINDGCDEDDSSSD